MTMINNLKNLIDYNATAETLKSTTPPFSQKIITPGEITTLNGQLGRIISTAEMVGLPDITHQLPSLPRGEARIDHRHGRRCNLFALAEIRHLDNPSVAGVLTNLSWNGMFVMTDATIPTNSCVDVQIALPNLEAALRYPGLVVHTNDNGFGMIFRELDDLAQNQVHWWLREY